MPKKGRRGQKPPAWVSQNYLTSHRIIQRLMRRTTLDASDHVIEIGPGKGHTTGALLKRCRMVTAVEVDQKLYTALARKFDDCPNLKLYRRDFLQWKLPTAGNYKVFSNIPFCHTTDILRKLTACKNPPTEAWLTMEKGAAKRFMGTPCETLQSLLIKPAFDLDIVYHFQREDFHPKPGVDVVLLRLKRKYPPDIPPSQMRGYAKFISVCLNVNKAGLRRYFTKRQLSRALREAGIHNELPGEILYVQWLCLFRCRCQYAARR